MSGTSRGTTPGHGRPGVHRGKAGLHARRPHARAFKGKNKIFDAAINGNDKFVAEGFASLGTNEERDRFDPNKVLKPATEAFMAPNFESFLFGKQLQGYLLAGGDGANVTAARIIDTTTLKQKKEGGQDGPSYYTASLDGSKVWEDAFYNTLLNSVSVRRLRRRQAQYHQNAALGRPGWLFPDL